jgi:hypothetical protein
MNLDRVTITGADESVSPRSLLDLSAEFPFVEWGILVSSSHTGFGEHSPRFPSQVWIDRLLDACGPSGAYPAPALSLHVCGKWVRDLLMGNISVPSRLGERQAFQRVQLNFHAERVTCNPRPFFNALLAMGPRQYIFQIDGADGNKHLESLYALNDSDHSIDAVPLFDTSGGAGVLPRQWPRPQYMSTDRDFIYHGYAGGLGPDTLPDELPKIDAASAGARIWIDMERRVRSDDDEQFDLVKVRRCLELCAPLVSQAVA